MEDVSTALIAIIIAVLSYAIAIYFAIRLIRKARAKRKAGILCDVRLRHIGGLNIPSGTNCYIACYKQGLMFEALGQRFYLMNANILNVSVVTDNQNVFQYGANTGRSVIDRKTKRRAFGLFRIWDRNVFDVFGVSGGISGAISHYFIVTYRSGYETRYAKFDCGMKTWKARKIAKHFTGISSVVTGQSYL